MQKIADVVIYQDDGYNTFPSIAKGSDGTLLVAFRHAPDRRAEFGGLITHGDPEAVAYLVRSTDGGKSWSAPSTILKMPGISVQDPCLTTLSNGNILMTTFFWKFYDKSQKQVLEDTFFTSFKVLDMFADRVMVFYGAHSLISRDGGQTFEGPYLIDKVYAIRGQCVELPNGTILAPMYQAAGGFVPKSQVAIFASRDGGITWDPYSFVTNGLGESNRCDEPTLFRTKSGRIFCFIRTGNGMYYCYSDDDGLTWTERVATDLPASVPYNALQLPSGNVLLTYGHRKEPYGVRALLLDAECSGPYEASREFVMRDDGLGADISYNHAAVLPNGDAMCIYYFHNDNFDKRRHIAATIIRE